MTDRYPVTEAEIERSLKGKINTMDLTYANKVADLKRGQGLRVRLNDRGFTQGSRIYPITVSWWS